MTTTEDTLRYVEARELRTGMKLRHVGEDRLVLSAVSYAGWTTVTMLGCTMPIGIPANKRVLASG